MYDGKNAAAPESQLLGADPTVSANLYCSRRLDELIAGVVLPALRESQSLLRDKSGDAGSSFLWIMRYSRCGEHLKLRWHGPVELASEWRALVEAHWSSYLLGLPSAEGEEPTPPLTTSPIDLEDQATSPYPDRSLLWTQYKRSHVSLGYFPYLNDDHYVGRLVRCLGAGTEVLLDTLESRGEKVFDFRSRQTIFIKAVLALLAELPFSAAERSSFLHYQRDVLLRDYRKRKNYGLAHLELLLEKFAAQVGLIEQAGRKLTDQAFDTWAGGQQAGWMAPFETWSRAIRTLHDYVDPICRDLEHHIDPFAESPIFPALFKAIHGFSNQLGLKALDEAFSYHLILHFMAASGQPMRPVRLRPIL